MLPFLTVFLFCGLLHAEGFPKELTLKQALKIALENNPEIRLADLELKIKDSEVKRQIASYIPTFKLDSSYTYSKDDPDNSDMKTENQNYDAGIVQKLPFGGELSISGNYGRSDYSAYQTSYTGYRFGPGFAIESYKDYMEVASMDNYYTGINLFYKQSILKDGIFGPVFAPVKESRLSRDIQKEVKTSSEINIIRLVTIAFYEAALRQKESQIYQEIFIINTQLYKDLKSKHALGMISEIDVMSAMVKENETKISVLSSIVLLETTLKTLKILLNIKDSIKVECRFESDSLSFDTESLISFAMESNRELARLNKSLDRGKLRAAVAKNRYLPQVDIYAGVDLKYQGDTFSKADNLEKTEYKAGIVFVYPFYPVAPRENYRQAKKRVQQMTIELVKTKLKITNEINMLCNQINLVEKKISVQSRQIEILKERMDLALLAFKERLIDLNIVYNIQDDRISGERKYFAFLFEYQVLLSAIKELTGEL